MKVYPPDKKHSYWHTKHGFRAWRDVPLTSKIALFTAIAALIVSYIK